ncbi:MAG: carboxymuconolactone decarboxylase family protein [Planctomycetaceae bacterium]|jgi:lipoyl-dependent peroxiredoxin subunit D|nr:carboxymuconolactone decarboxylase family protein [Planctomycetaceae bacterium]
MSRIAPLSESEASDKAAQTYARIKEVFEVDEIPEPFLLMGRVPAFLQDFYMNFKKFVMGEGKLNERERLVIAIAVAANAGSDSWIQFLRDKAGEMVTDEQFAEIASLVSTNSMYNTFFKFRDLSGSEIFDGMSVGLRAHVFSGTSFDEKMVELINTAISDINACKPCTAGHVKKARNLGISDERLLEAIQVAAVIQAGVKYTQIAG